jgi:DNA-directed RNA polymerase specialized sigma24 family protein
MGDSSKLWGYSMTEPRFPRNGRTIAQASAITGLSPRTIRRWTSRSRDEWLQQKANEREEIRAFHDDQNHSWTETAAHFHLDVSTVKRRAYRARKEREQGQASQDPSVGNR